MRLVKYIGINIIIFWISKIEDYIYIYFGWISTLYFADNRNDCYILVFSFQLWYLQHNLITRTWIPCFNHDLSQDTENYSKTLILNKILYDYALIEKKIWFIGTKSHRAYDLQGLNSIFTTKPDGNQSNSHTKHYCFLLR